MNDVETKLNEVNELLGLSLCEVVSSDNKLYEFKGWKHTSDGTSKFYLSKEEVKLLADAFSSLHEAMSGT